MQHRLLSGPGMQWLHVQKQCSVLNWLQIAALNAAADKVNPVEEQVCSVLALMAMQTGCPYACRCCRAIALLALCCLHCL